MCDGPVPNFQELEGGTEETDVTYYHLRYVMHNEPSLKDFGAKRELYADGISFCRNYSSAELQLTELSNYPGNLFQYFSKIIY